MVDGVGLGQNNLGDGDEGVAILEELLNNTRQRLRRVESGIVKENDGARLYLTGNPLGNFTGGEIFPV